MPKFVGFFAGLGIPAPSLNAHFVAVLETGGGILLALGLGSRLIALLLASDMFVAFVTADREALRSIFSDIGQILRRSALYLLVCLPDYPVFRSRQALTGLPDICLVEKTFACSCRHALNQKCKTRMLVLSAWDSSVSNSYCLYFSFCYHPSIQSQQSDSK